MSVKLGLSKMSDKELSAFYYFLDELAAYCSDRDRDLVWIEGFCDDCLQVIRVELMNRIEKGLSIPLPSFVEVGLVDIDDSVEIE